MNRKQKIGSETARGGFKNESDMVKKFNNYSHDSIVQEWLLLMGYKYQLIESFKALPIPPRIPREKALELGSTKEKFDDTIKYKKADIQIQLEIQLEGIIYRENLSLKKANATANFNQIDKRSVETYQKMWGFSDNVLRTLKKFTGATIPNETEKHSLKDERRWYLTELPKKEVQRVIEFFELNKVLVISDILRGRGALSADWFLVTRKDVQSRKIDWTLKPINEVINFYSQGKVCVSKRGGLKLCMLTAQRKGGTPDPTSLQFKISPLALFDIK